MADAWPTFSSYVLLRSRAFRRDWLVGASLANVLFVDVWGILFLAHTTSAFHLTVYPVDYWSAMLGVPLIGLGLALAVHVVRRANSPAASWIARLGFIAAAVLTLEPLRRFYGVLLPDAVALLQPLLRELRAAGVVLLAALALGCVVWWARPIARGLAMIFLALSPFMLITIGRGVWTIATTNFEGFADRLASAPEKRGSAQRVVLIVFDELDGNVAFHKRPHDLELPEFDALRREAVFFDSAYAPASSTLPSMMSLLYGEIVKDVQRRTASVAEIELVSQPVRTDSAPNLFSRAAGRGYRAAMAGLYLPYCRMGFPMAQCQWQPMINGGSITGERRSLAGTLVRQVASVTPLYNRITHIRRTRDLKQAAIRFSTDSTLDLVVAHLPVPHSPTIFDRGSGRYRITDFTLGGYVDNVALADRILGEIRREMSIAGVWDRTTVIVTSDHPWRQRTNSDARIPLIVRIGPDQEGRVTRSVNTVVLQSVILEILAGQVRDTHALTQHMLRPAVRLPQAVDREARAVIAASSNSR